MLEPNSRRLLLESLQPPVDYQLDCAVGTTYTLDLMALLTAPVAFAFSDFQDAEGRPAADPLALLKAVRQYASRVCLFCQAGKIHVPRAYQPLLASLEDSIVEANAPQGGSFHPKLWFLRFTNPADDGVIYRLLCLSRNMTFDRSWDTLLSLEGPLLDRTNAYRRNHPLGQFVETLPRMSARAMSPAWKKQLERLAWEIRRVDFEVPKPFDEFAFHPIGAGVTNQWPFPDRIDELLVVSPFVQDGLLSDLSEWDAPMSLLSRPESLARLTPETLELFEDVWTLDDAADPEPGDAEQEATTNSGDAESDLDESELPLVGLHAKVYVAEHGWNASVLTGSANATRSAFNRNVEFLVELIGKKSRCGVDAVLGQANDDSQKRVASLRDLLQDYVPVETESEDDKELEQFERLVDAVAREIAAAAPVANVHRLEESESFSVTLQATRKRKSRSLQKCRLQARPISHSAAELHGVDCRRAEWVCFQPVSLLGLTSFYVFEATSIDEAMSRQFVLNIPLQGVPVNRQEAVLRDLLSDPDRVMRFLLLLLMDSGARDISRLFDPSKKGGEMAAFGQSLFGSTLFESLVRALDRDPQRLDHVAEVIDDLRQTPEGCKLLPEDIDTVWEPIWTVRQQQLAEGVRRR